MRVDDVRAFVHERELDVLSRLAVALLFATSCQTRSAPAPVTDEELAGYAHTRQADAVVEALALAPGQIVADIGCGQGAFTLLLARAVGPTGHVVATDVDPGALGALQKRAGAKGPHAASQARIETRHVRPDAPGLEPGRYDLLFLSDVDQYLPDRARYFQTLRPALTPTGRLVVTNRMIYRDAVIAAARGARFSLVGDRSAALQHFVLEFRAEAF